jgi:glycosyltransferase involved in cell wall biosynthesis
LVDDASTDGSTEKLLEFKDPRLKVLRRDTPGPGGYAARNAGIAQAKNEWICFLDADDKWELHLLETLTEVIGKNPEAEFLCWGWYKVNGSKRMLDGYSQIHKQEPLQEFTLKDFFKGPQPMWTGAVCVKNELIHKAGRFPEQGFKRGGDMDTWIRCLSHSKKNLRINQIMSYYNVDSVNMVTKTVDPNISYSFSANVLNLLNTTQDKDLKKAIKQFQNRRVYATLSQQISSGKGIDPQLLAKMNLNASYYYYLTRLLLKNMLFKTRILKNKIK